MTPLEILKGARELIADPKRWCRGTFARGASGMGVMSMDDGVKWCAIGALLKVGGCDNLESIGRAEYSLITAIGSNSEDSLYVIGGFNDSHDHAEVLALFDKAIASVSP